MFLAMVPEAISRRAAITAPILSFTGCLATIKRASKPSIFGKIQEIRSRLPRLPMKAVLKRRRGRGRPPRNVKEAYDNVMLTKRMGGGKAAGTKVEARLASEPGSRAKKFSQLQFSC
jgi:hypothetical protein